MATGSLETRNEQPCGVTISWNSSDANCSWSCDMPLMPPRAVSVSVAPGASASEHWRGTPRHCSRSFCNQLTTFPKVGIKFPRHWENLQGLLTAKLFVLFFFCYRRPLAFWRISLNCRSHFVLEGRLEQDWHKRQFITPCPKRPWG
jgi:hypothetical protein